MTLCSLGSGKVLSFTLIAMSLTFGWLIPHFYAWTDSDQSRPSPWLWIAPLVLANVSLVFCFLLPWFRIEVPEAESEPPLRTRYGMRTLMGLMTVVALASPWIAKFPMVISGLVCGLAFANYVRVMIHRPRVRFPALAILACMYFPFAWVFGYKELDRIFMTFLSIVFALPTLVPAAWIGSAFGMGLQSMYWIAILLTAFELTLGAWLVCLGPRRSITYAFMALTISIVSSIAFYQLCVA